MYCTFCKTAGHEGRYCADCGGRTIFAQFECADCTATNYVTDKFCKGCGRPIHEQAAEVIKRREKGEEVR